MWLSVDRIEGKMVILISDKEEIYSMSAEAYTALVGQAPKEAHMLSCELQGDAIRSARYSPEETARRTEAAKERLNRLANKNK